MESSNIEYIKALKVQKGDILVHDDEPYFVQQVRRFKPGKHGPLRFHFFLSHILTGEEIDFFQRNNLEVPRAKTNKEIYLCYGTKGNTLHLNRKKGDLPKEVTFSKLKSLEYVNKHIIYETMVRGPIMIIILKCMDYEIPIGFRKREGFKLI